jgi:DNA-binding NtrC family response regulator
MFEAVSVASRQVLVLEPFDVLDTLLQPLQAAGWSLKPCPPERLVSEAADVLLLSLERPPSLALLKLVQRSGLSCVAVTQNQRLSQFCSEQLVGEWLFAALSCPLEMPVLLETLQQAQVASRLLQLKGARQAAQFLGNSGPARSVRKSLDSLARCDGPLLLCGERGSGKHLLAHLLHQRSPRARQNLHCIDCAVGFDIGLLSPAKPGTVLLENVEQLSEADQQRLLEHLQRHPHAALLTLDQGELMQAVQRRRFTPELFQSLAPRQLHTPNLREHPGDLLLLAEHFAQQHGTTIARHHRRFSDEALEAMTGHPWPGNVRELRNRVVRALVLAQGRQIVAVDLGLQPVQPGVDAPVTLEDYILRAERQALNDVLGRYTHNMSQAARTLGISRPTFYRLLHKHRMR